jgi:hypothetical protein
MPYSSFKTRNSQGFGSPRCLLLRVFIHPDGRQTAVPFHRKEIGMTDEGFRKV